MCTIFLASQMETKRSGDAVCYQWVKFKRTEPTEHRKRPVTMKWIVVADEHGGRRLQMRWTIERSSVPSTFRSAKQRVVQPAMGRGCAPTPGPETRVAIS